MKANRYLPALGFGLAAAAFLLAGERRTGGLDKANLDLPYNTAGGREDGEDAPEVVVFYGHSVEADGVVFCLDRSMSMGDGEWATLKCELTRAVSELSSASEFGLVFFDSEAVVYPQNRTPARASAANKAATLAWAQAMEPSQRSTCLLEGLKAAIEVVSRATVKKKAILFLSDGKATCVGQDSVTYTERTLREVKELNSQRVPIHALGLGYDAAEHFLKALAAENGGTYRRIQN